MPTTSLYPLRVTADTVCVYSPYKKDFGQMLRGEFHKSLPLLLTDQQLSVLRSLCTIPHPSISLSKTGIRVPRYSGFVNVKLLNTFLAFPQQLLPVSS